jgi:hypothetical protein
MDKYLEKFGSNFLVAAFVPSLSFTIICFIFFGPLFLPQDILDLFKSINLPSDYGQFGLALLTAIILSFSLSSLNIFILKILEGYVVLEHFPFLLSAQKKRERKMRKGFEQLKKKTNRLDKLAGKCTSPKLQDRYNHYIEKITHNEIGLVTYHHYAFAADESEIMPTEFGNILKAAEYHSRNLYRIDAVPMWPRLVHLIDEVYYRGFEQSYNELSFLVNCMVLCLFFSFISLPVCIYLGVIQSGRVWLYVSLMGFSFAAAYIFHRASLFSVGQYGDMIRGAFDLFRYKLLTALGQQMPSTLLEEKYKWEAICEFLNVGEYRGDMTLDYPQKDPPPVREVIKVRKRSVKSL